MCFTVLYFDFFDGYCTNIVWTLITYKRQGLLFQLLLACIFLYFLLGYVVHFLLYYIHHYVISSPVVVHFVQLCSDMRYVFLKVGFNFSPCLFLPYFGSKHSKIPIQNLCTVSTFRMINFCILLQGAVLLLGSMFFSFFASPTFSISLIVSFRILLSGNPLYFSQYSRFHRCYSWFYYFSQNPWLTSVEQYWC